MSRSVQSMIGVGLRVFDKAAFAMKRNALIVTFLPLFAICWIVWDFWGSPWTVLRIAGLALLGVGLILLTLARIQLGNSFSMKPEATELVTHGLYARIRNPIYVFGTLVIAGLALYISMPFLLLAFLVVIPLQVVRAMAEARVLEEKFGEEYRAYRARTWF
ncbi:MAG: isoprenylcysteine carboxylmethyltransferase family protein [Acidobacteria bacterium]|nr:isoprenylcysteine carboxylmethyltransferase family protein [Acidobacteriota bacterium]MBS1864573.1 isoprenylcysteine carboxylmethyltransferase family protein [Acidobacteriota bacterium]